MMMEISDVQGPELGSDLYPGNDNGPRMSERSLFTACYYYWCCYASTSVRMVLLMDFGFRFRWFCRWNLDFELVGLSWLLEMILFDFMLTDIPWQV